MRIAYVTADFGVPLRGSKGASVHVRQMVGALARTGHEVLLLSPTSAEGLAMPPGCTAVQVPMPAFWPQIDQELALEPVCRDTRLAKDIRNLVYAGLLAGEAALLLAEFRPDFIYERYSLFGTAGLELARRCAVPLILEVNAPLIREQSIHRGLSLPGAARRAEEIVFRGAGHVFTVSSALRSYVIAQGAPPQRVSVMPNAADPELFDPSRTTPATHGRPGWEDRFVIGFVGAMKPWHGVTSLVEAFARLAASSPRYRLLLVGDGPEADAVRSRVRELELEASVHMTGAVPHESIPAWVAGMDVAVAPYAAAADEYFSPVKLFEYMAMARPIVAARLGQVAEVIEHGRTGWLYDPADAGELAERLLWLGENLAIARQAGAAARDYVLAHHTWDGNARQVAEIAAMRRGESG